MKNEVPGKVMTEIKRYSYLTDDSDKNNKEKGTKKCVIIKCLNNKAFLVSPTYIFHMFQSKGRKVQNITQ